MQILIPRQLAQHIANWNYERKALEDVEGAPYGMAEANRDSAVDLLHSIAILIEDPNHGGAHYVEDISDEMGG